MDWFERLTGFREQSYDSTRARLEVQGEHLHIIGSPQAFCVGNLELPTLGELRSRLGQQKRVGELQFCEIVGDACALHQAHENEGALFQVASQFNLLEMVGPHVSPEDGVTRYQSDHTQGPACAIAAGAATLYRNYLVPVAGQIGQTSACQLDTLSDVTEYLAGQMGVSPSDLWTMRNGYLQADSRSVGRVGGWLETATEKDLDDVRSRLRIGLHWDVEVTHEPEVSGTLVNQAFCSAIPISYSPVTSALWEPLARLILESAYEATFAAAALNAARGKSTTLYLTRVGGGAFGNAAEWIDAALQRSLCLFADWPLRVMMVQYGRS